MAEAHDEQDPEARRLARLRALKILNTAPEPAFDSLARVAAAICGTPIALISLIDEDRQWFKANIGLDGTAETPRSIAFCDHAIREAHVMEVRDAQQDPRFVANPLVTGSPHIRFYAGAPITMSTGEAVGTLCVIHDRPASLTPAQLEGLRELANVARTMLEQRARIAESVSRDIELREAKERELRTANSFLARAEALSGVGGWEVDLVNLGVKWTGQNYRIFDADPAKPIAPDHHRRYFDDASLDAIDETYARAIRDNAPWDIELPCTTEAGRSIWIRSAGHAEFEDGMPVRLVGVLQDITHIKAEREMQLASHRLLAAVVENLPCAVSVFDGGFRLIAHNRQFRELLDFPDDLFERDAPPTLEDFIRFDAARGEYGGEPPESVIARVAQQALTPSRHVLMRVHTRAPALEVRRAPMPGGGFVTTYVDVTEILRAREAAEAANRAKTEFMDTVSHEIRTPLNGVIGMTQLLGAEPLTPQQRRYVALADSSARELLELINDLLDLGKIEAGRVELESVPFRLDEVTDHLAELYRLRAKEKNLGFRVEIAPGVPAMVLGDSTRLRQILNNLLSNALKFTQQGEFGLVVSRGVASRGADMLSFTVHDTGIGIASEARDRLFMRFSQADSSTTRKFGGTGLGLAIVKQLCELMGGTITLQTEAGRGSSFRCELPLPRVDDASAQEPAAAPAERAARAVRVLVAEDNPVNQIVVQGLLSHAGYDDVVIVDNGRAAVDAAAQEAFDAVLMDCRMPEMDGYQATAILRQRGFRAPIIALTANASEAERERCLAQGMNDFLTKPVDGGQLADALARWLQPDGASRAPAPALAAVEPQPAPVFDREKSLRQLGGDEELLAVALMSYRQTAPQLLDKARSALAAGNAGELHRHLHTLAGSSGMMGADTLLKAARELEAQAEAGRWEQLRSGFTRLESLMDRFMQQSAS